MEEKLLCTCADHIVANRVTDILETNGIAFRLHDETADVRKGTYGPVPGVSIYVYEKDHEMAAALVEPVTGNDTLYVGPYCPKCGSEDVAATGRSRYATLLLVLSIFFMLLPAMYFFYSNDWGIKSPAADYVALALLLSSFVMMIACRRLNANYRCRKCGRRFFHA